MVTGAITELWRYPVKSLQGEPLSATALTDVIPGDRGWGVVDSDTGYLMSAKRHPALLSGRARLDGERCVITLPDGSEITADDSRVHAVLSDWLGQPVRLATPEAHHTAMIEIELDEGLDEEGELPVSEFATQPGWFYDSTSSLHIISTGTLDHVSAEVGPDAGAVTRFRPNIVVELASPFEEERWVGEVIRLGSATARVKKPTDRCVVITRAQPAFAASRDTLRFLARANDRNAGISAQPREAGTVAVGDAIEVARSHR